MWHVTVKSRLVVRVGLEWTMDMAAYVAIFAAALSGFAGLGLWPIGAISAVLVALSFTDYGALYLRAAERGFIWEARATFVQSCANAVAASGIAYVAGVVFRLV